MPENEVYSLIVKAHERVDAAVLLHTDGYYEDAVSRTHYAMFYAARALLVSQGIVVKTHRELSQKLGNYMLRPVKWNQKSGEILLLVNLFGNPMNMGVR